MTINAARQIGQGDRLGSLEKGKEADFTILESDPYKVSPDAIADIKVSETWVAGEWKFAAWRGGLEAPASQPRQFQTSLGH